MSNPSSSIERRRLLVAVAALVLCRRAAGRPQGTTATDTSGNQLNGTYVRGYTQGDSSPVSGTGSAVAFNGSTGTMNSGSTSMSVPSSYSVETWFKTSGSTNGKLIGLGNSATGTSTSTDHNLYVLGNGKLV